MGDANADITGVNEDNPCSYALLGYMDIIEHGPEWWTEAILVLRKWLFIRRHVILKFLRWQKCLAAICQGDQRATFFCGNPFKGGG